MRVLRFDLGGGDVVKAVMSCGADDSVGEIKLTGMEVSRSGILITR